MKKPLTIGRLAQAADVNIETIRYYQRIGLLIKPEKPVSGYCIYPDTMIMRIHFIKRAQQLGFKLQEVAELLQLGDGQCEDVCSLAEQKCAQVTQQVKGLKKLQKTLEILIKTCRSDGDQEHCPIVEALTAK